MGHKTGFKDRKFWQACSKRIRNPIKQNPTGAVRVVKRRLVEQHRSPPSFTSLIRELGVERSNPADVQLPELMPSPLNEIEPDLWMVAASLTLWSGIGYLGYFLYKRCLSKRDVQTPVVSTRRAIY